MDGTSAVPYRHRFCAHAGYIPLIYIGIITFVSKELETTLPYRRPLRARKRRVHACLLIVPRNLLPCALFGCLLLGAYLALPMAQTPTVHTETVSEQVTVPFPIQFVEDAALPAGESAIRQQGQDGLAQRTRTYTYEGDTLLREQLSTPQVLRQPVVQIIATGTDPDAKDTASTLSFTWPVSGRLSSPFGVRDGREHQGIDIAVPTGTRVCASAAGTVQFAGEKGGYGLCVDVAHAGGYVTRYAHNSELCVRAGQSVEAGELLALSGSTGNSTGPHVHFEIRRGEQIFDPLLLLPSAS